MGPPHIELVLPEVPEAAQQGQKAVRILEVVGEIEFPGQFSPRTAGYLHVVATKPHNVLQFHLLRSYKRLAVENCLSYMRQSVVRTGSQTRGQALVLGRLVLGRGRGQAESLTQRW
ncbi:hypothetical protein GCM10018785_26840 [Streptomyces longispororuber]|uniref:Uncharacterized protein n=1 Tax=Streptomyces longispororuber TaxID=68230 RepID=A0A919DM97_9ACTN|nr:hypothetical protein GCM10018785_26840 [Streptomyces longispororuber]